MTTSPNNTKETKERLIEEFFARFKSQGEKMLVVKAEEYEAWLRTALDELEANVREEIQNDLHDVLWNEDGSLKSPHSISDNVSAVMHYFHTPDSRQGGGNDKEL